ncbi:MAG: hypothetical protein JRI36_02480 [Deltaproteobacteria bacterium]|nr:hypothetical protein [Deltaproteobacteria bacterium]
MITGSMKNMMGFASPLVLRRRNRGVEGCSTWLAQ